MKNATYSLEDLKEAIKNNNTIASCLRQLKLSITTSNYKTIKKYISLYDIDTSHWIGQAHLKNKTHVTKNTIPLEKILVEKSYYSCMARLKIRLLKENYLTYKCSICNIDTWNGKRITLQIDHINGISNDNRIENLRLLCPNCHSQTETFSGKNKKKIIHFCNICNKQKRKKDIVCCNKVARKTKIQWPSKEELEKLVWEKPTSQISKTLGVSDKAIEKHCKKLGIAKPPRGYWN